MRRFRAVPIPPPTRQLAITIRAGQTVAVAEAAAASGDCTCETLAAHWLTTPLYSLVEIVDFSVVESALTITSTTEGRVAAAFALPGLCEGSDVTATLVDEPEDSSVYLILDLPTLKIWGVEISLYSTPSITFSGTCGGVAVDIDPLTVDYSEEGGGA